MRVTSDGGTKQCAEFDPTPDAAAHEVGHRDHAVPGREPARLRHPVRQRPEGTAPRPGLVEVRYVHFHRWWSVRVSLDVSAPAPPVDRGRTLAVVSATDAPPSELRVNVARRPVPHPREPGETVRGRRAVADGRRGGRRANPAADRLKPVFVTVRNAGSADSEPLALQVLGREEVKIAPPTIQLRYKGGSTRARRTTGTAGRRPAVHLRSGLQVTSDNGAPLRGSRSGPAPAADTGELVDGVKPADAVAVPGRPRVRRDRATLSSAPAEGTT